MNESFEEVTYERNKFASEEDIDAFHCEIREAIKTKSEELDIPMQELMSELGTGEYDIEADQNEAETDEDMSDDNRILDWKSLGGIGNPNGRKFTLGEIEQIKSDVLETVNKYPKVDNVSDLLEFVSKHKNKINSGMLVLYLSALGTPLLDALVSHDVKIDNHGVDINAKDLIKNAEISKVGEKEVPRDILQDFNMKPLSSEKGASLKFTIDDSNDSRIKIGASGVYDPSATDPKGKHEQYKKIENSLDAIFEKDKTQSTDGDLGSYSIDLGKFKENREKVVTSIADAMDLSPEEVNSYFDKLLELNDHKAAVSLVPIEKIDFSKSKDTKGELTRFYEGVLQKHNISNPEEKKKAVEECEEYAKNNGYGDFWHSLNKEMLENPFNSLDNHEVDSKILFNVAYTKIVEQELKEHCDVNELKKDPEKAYKAVFDVLKEKMDVKDDQNGQHEIEKIFQSGDYGQKQTIVNNFLEGKKIDSLPSIIELQDGSLSQDTENWILKNFDVKKIEESKDNPETVIKQISDFIAVNFSDDKGFSTEDRCNVFMGIKHLLTEKGLSGFDKFGVVLTLDEKGQVKSEIITTDENGKVIESVVNFSTIKDGEKGINSEEAHKIVLNELEGLRRLEEIRESLSYYDNKTVGGSITEIREAEDRKQKSLLKKIREKIGNIGKAE
jgi:hypothetical protein